MQLDILDRPVAFAADGRVAGRRAQALFADAKAMADDINALAGRLSDEQTDTFRLAERLVLFTETRYRGKRMRRSFMAQAERTFWWHVQEFDQTGPARRRLTYYFHDCWHLVQFERDGPAPNERKVLIDREQDAMVQQLDVARRCQCDSALIGFLEGYATDRDKIAERLRQGVGFNARLVPHFAIL